MRGGSVNPLNTSLYAVYKAESNANDSLATYNGTAQGGLTYSGGKSGNAFTFNGTNAYVNLPNNSFNFTGDFSISFWVLFTSLNSEQVPFSNYYESAQNAGNARGYMVYVAGNVLYWIVNGSTGVNLTTAISSFENTWSHVTITFKSGVGSKIYTNGTLATSNSSTVTPLYNTTHSPSIGCYKYGNTTVDGLMKSGSEVDELNIWNKELSSTEITELYNAGVGKFYPY